MNQPAILGILNLTPDSFSGDGVVEDMAVKRAAQLTREGADIIDIGAESTRPGATPLSADEEWVRVAPVLRVIHEAPWRSAVRLSIDTRHAQTAARALEYQVEFINDVGGLQSDAMCEALEEHECDVIVMHALSVPANPAVTLPEGSDVVAAILAWKVAILKRAAAHGIGAHRLVFDPGIGFGKTAEQSLALITRAGELKASGGRWLYGHSRKSFMKLMGEGDATTRDPLTREFSKKLADAGIDYLRVHDVAGHVNMFDAHA